VSEAGHNSVAADELRLLIERIERLEEEKKGVADDIKDIYIEAKARGYVPKILRDIVRIRKMTSDDRGEHFSILQVYASAIGMDLL
jgi:uncharacterized protein (UPF0335 family)